MSNLADLQLSFLSPCDRCAGLLFGQVRFCPYCGEPEAVVFGNRLQPSGLQAELTGSDLLDETRPLWPTAAAVGGVRRHAASGTVALLLLVVLVLVLGYNQLGDQVNADTWRALSAKLGATPDRSRHITQKTEPIVKAVVVASEQEFQVPAAPASAAPAPAESPARDQPCSDMLAALALCSPASTSNASATATGTADPSTKSTAVVTTHAAAFEALQVKTDR